jgi:hypothetical protein
MSSFTSPLITECLPDGRNFKLHSPFTYHVGNKYSNLLIKVPKGFTTDFASTPSFLWWWLPPIGKYTKAAVLHDYLYQTHECTRQFADRVFEEAMIVFNTPVWKARLMYYAIRLFGWLAWK